MRILLMHGIAVSKCHGRQNRDVIANVENASNCENKRNTDGTWGETQTFICAQGSVLGCAGCQGAVRGAGPGILTGKTIS